MSTTLNELTHQINSEAEKLAKQPPQIVLDIFQQGKMKNNAGTRGQYFSTLVFVQGVCRALTYDCVNNLIYLFDDKSFTKEHLQIMIPRYLRSNANFLGYCGFDKVWNFAQQIINCQQQASSKEELSELINAYNYYLANLYTWVQHYFPWEIGDNFLQPEEASQTDKLK